MLETINLTHTYYFRGEANTPLHSFSKQFEMGIFSVITGESGCGKTTLLNSLAGLLAPTEGNILLDGDDLYKMNGEKLAALRRSRISVVPQCHSLLPGLTVYENILFYASLSGILASQAASDALKLLEIAQLTRQKDMRQEDLSGGEQRRVSILRSLIIKPDYVIADEPTSNLDHKNREIILKLLRKSADEGTGIILASHESDSLHYADQEIQI